jgi:hypothetical protein
MLHLSSRAGYYGKADVHYAAVSGYCFGRTVGQRLCALLQENLTAFPAKYPLYDVEPWSSAGIRQYVTRNDVILYSVDENRSCVYIRSVCTRGRDLDLHLSEQSESVE